MFDTILETIFTIAFLTNVKGYMSLHVSTPSLLLPLLRISDDGVHLCTSTTMLQMRSLSLDPHLYLSISSHNILI
jgi:hypothetical protein